jgi:hypothetical protein
MPDYSKAQIDELRNRENRDAQGRVVPKPTQPPPQVIMKGAWSLSDLPIRPATRKER